MTGKPKTPTRAPMAKLRVTRLTTTQTTTAMADGSGASTDHRADEGQHRAAAAEAGEDRPGVPDHRRRARRRSPPTTARPSTTPTAAASAPLATSPAKTGRAARRPSASLAFQ